MNEQNFGDWIDIKDYLPVKDQEVIILFSNNTVSSGWCLTTYKYNDNKLTWYKEEDCWIRLEVTKAWMPLPPPPKS